MRLRILLAAVVALALPMSASAQTQAATATITISSNLTLTVTELTVDFGTQDTPGAYPGDVSSVIDHGGNVTHSVYIAADQTHFDAVNSANDAVVAASQMEWSIDGSVWTPLSTTPVAIISAAAPGSYDDAATVQYRITVEIEDAPDTYTLPFTYSILADS